MKRIIPSFKAVEDAKGDLNKAMREDMRKRYENIMERWDDLVVRFVISFERDLDGNIRRLIDETEKDGFWDGTSSFNRYSKVIFINKKSGKEVQSFDLPDELVDKIVDNPNKVPQYIREFIERKYGETILEEL